MLHLTRSQRNSSGLGCPPPRIQSWPGCHCRPAAVLLRSARGEILIAGLQRADLDPGAALEVHAKPDRPDEQTSDPSRDVLRDLGALVAGEVLHALIIGVCLEQEGGAVGKGVVGWMTATGLGAWPAHAASVRASAADVTNDLVVMGGTLVE